MRTVLYTVAGALAGLGLIELGHTLVMLGVLIAIGCAASATFTITKRLR